MEKKTGQRIRRLSWRSVLLGIATGFLTSAVLAAFAAWMIESGRVGESVMQLMARISLSAGALLGGWIAAKHAGTAAFPHGLMTGGVGTALRIVLPILSERFSGLTGDTAFSAVCMLLGGALGGLLAAQRKKRKKHKK